MSATWDPYSAQCPSRKLLDKISGKWTILVIGLLQNGKLRFSQLKREIDGISQKMLTQTLRSLEADGLLKRYVYPTVPVTVEYELTELGQDLNRVLTPVFKWAENNMGKIYEANSEYHI